MRYGPFGRLSKRFGISPVDGDECFEALIHLVGDVEEIFEKIPVLEPLKKRYAGVSLSRIRAAAHAKLGRGKSVLISHACESLLCRLHLDPENISDDYDAVNVFFAEVQEVQDDAYDN